MVPYNNNHMKILFRVKTTVADRKDSNRQQYKGDKGTQL